MRLGLLYNILKVGQNWSMGKCQNLVEMDNKKNRENYLNSVQKTKFCNFLGVNRYINSSILLTHAG